MATFARRLSDGRWHVRISGQLRAVDLRRLERICAPALEHYPTPLTLQLDALTGLDETARAFVQRLLARGATVIGYAGMLQNHRARESIDPDRDSSEDLTDRRGHSRTL